MIDPHSDLSDADDLGLTGDAAWALFSGVAAAGAALATRKTLELLWNRFATAEVPSDPTDSDTSWQEAVTWGVLAGALAGLARVIGKRGAASAWHRVTGHHTPT